jgi:hypothetical protein
MTTTHNPAWKAVIMLWAVVVLLPFGAEGSGSRARRAAGTVLVVDHETQTCLVKPPNAKRPLLLNWDKNTRFIHNQQFTNAVALTERVSIVVFYHSPLFGKPYMTKVMWGTGTG